MFVNYFTIQPWKWHVHARVSYRLPLSIPFLIFSNFLKMILKMKNKKIKQGINKIRLKINSEGFSK